MHGLVHFSIWYYVVLCGAALLLIFSTKLRVVGFIIFGIGLGLIRAQLVAPLPVFQYGKQEIIGTVIEAPDARRDSVRYTIQVDTKGSPKLLLRSALEPRFEIGDRLSFICRVDKPEPIEGFAYDRYLALDGITGTCSSQQVELVASGPVSLSRSLDQGRRWIVAQLNIVLPEPEASFSAGLLIGSRKGLPEELTTAFQRTGTAHLVALSGFNITIIVNILTGAAVRIIGRKRAFPVICVGVLLFIGFVGAQASIVRAGIMGLVAALGNHLGRPTRVLNALVLSGTIMVLLHPAILLDDVSFQLSFAATLGLVLLSEPFDKLLGFLPEQLSIREISTATISATFMTLPLTIGNFGRFSIVALPVNLIVLPFIPLAMGLSALGLLGSIIGQAIGQLFSLPAWLVLHFVLSVVTFAGTPNWSSLAVNAWLEKSALWFSFPIALVTFFIHQKFKSIRYAEK